LELTIDDHIEKSKVWETPIADLTCFSNGMKYCYFANKAEGTLIVLDALNEMKEIYRETHPHLKHARIVSCSE